MSSSAGRVLPLARTQLPIPAETATADVCASRDSGKIGNLRQSRASAAADGSTGIICERIGILAKTATDSGKIGNWLWQQVQIPANTATAVEPMGIERGGE